MITISKDGKTHTIRRCEHIVHVDNLQNILKNGLLSYNKARELNLLNKDISMQEVQNIRHTKKIVIDNEELQIENKIITLHDLVSLYFNSKNAMLYKLRNLRSKLIILVISIDIINNNHFIFSDGNAGSSNTNFYNKREDFQKLDIELISSSSWNDEDEQVKREKKRKVCSELLIYPSIIVEDIKGIACYNDTVRQEVNEIISRTQSGSHITVKVLEGWFF